MTTQTTQTTDRINHPSYGSDLRGTTTDRDLRALAAEYSVEVTITGSGPYTLDFGGGYVCVDCTFEAACEEIRAYTRS